MHLVLKTTSYYHDNMEPGFVQSPVHLRRKGQTAGRRTGNERKRCDEGRVFLNSRNPVFGVEILRDSGIIRI
jgi:hypothetical protein